MGVLKRAGRVATGGKSVLASFLRGKAVARLFDRADPADVRRAVPDRVLAAVERAVGLGACGGGTARERGRAALAAIRDHGL